MLKYIEDKFVSRDDEFIVIVVIFIVFYYRRVNLVSKSD